MKCPQVLGPFLSGKNGFSNDPTSLVCKRQIYSNYIYDIIWINTSWHIIRSPFSPCLQRHFSLGPDWEVAPTVVAEVWRVAFRQVVRIGESAKVGREVPWKCQRFGKTQGVQLVQPVSGDFLEIFWRFLERLIWKSPGQPALSARWIWRFFGEPLPSQEAVALVASRCHLLRAASRNNEPPDRGERKLLPWPRRCDMNWYD